MSNPEGGISPQEAATKTISKALHASLVIAAFEGSAAQDPIEALGEVAQALGGEQGAEMMKGLVEAHLPFYHDAAQYVEFPFGQPDEEVIRENVVNSLGLYLGYPADIQRGLLRAYQLELKIDHRPPSSN